MSKNLTQSIFIVNSNLSADTANFITPTDLINIANHKSNLFKYIIKK